ncbi:MAG: PD-(D/E)XK nuclease family transposase [Kiritimatiellae bacterium]|nr:PD-(D/E)XK nuclease family transposase [Kiritimatiellia bacterium]
MRAKIRQFVSFDWAMKKLLRSKANFGVLNGFLSELLEDDITITELLESEGGREYALDKANRVDFLVKDSTGKRIIIEIQYKDEADYFHRMAFGVSKLIASSINKGQIYADIDQVISVNLVYFELGQGTDYVYCGQTTFRGRHDKDLLDLNDKQKKVLGLESINEIFPTFYILRINEFNDLAKTGLDQWIYFLKNEALPKEITAKGLREAKEKLDIMKLSATERAAYDEYQEQLRIEASEIEFSIKRAEVAEEALKEERHQKEEALKREREERHQKEEALKREREERRQKDDAFKLIKELEAQLKNKS